ncbi:MAG: GNAT family N-acetyltransferase [Rhodothermales bacterium]|nr:GNAT family N-acetyltransferase [Rhodothermales bacterium]
MSDSIVILPARKYDESSILDVMRPWNMHHVPSPEMEELDLSRFFVALSDGKVIGAAGYKILTPTTGKTTLLGVLPGYGKQGVGKRLHHARCQAMYKLGIRKVTTNSDLPSTIRWYQQHFGYKTVGTLKKVSSFGSPDIDHWTTMEMDLEAYRNVATEKF